MEKINAYMHFILHASNRRYLRHFIWLHDAFCFLLPMLTLCGEYIRLSCVSSIGAAWLPCLGHHCLCHHCQGHHCLGHHCLGRLSWRLAVMSWWSGLRHTMWNQNCVKPLKVQNITYLHSTIPNKQLNLDVYTWHSEPV